jgi:hypothetical protein
MARSRNIKPAFFLNEELSELAPLVRLAFIAMWTVADFKGCLELKPKRLKLQTLPYDDCDIEDVCESLNNSGLIRIYSAQGQRYIKIVNFEKHQNPHKNEREAGSEIPDIDENSIEIKELHKDGTKPDLIGSARADSLLLIPDSLKPISSSLIAENGIRAKAPKAAKKCPDDFVITEQMRDWAISEGLLIDIDAETRVFKDHTFTSAKSDWLATWRNWIRRANGFKQKSGILTQKESFKEKDAKAARELYERVTGKVHPENPLFKPLINSMSQNLIEVTHEPA